MYSYQIPVRELTSRAAVFGIAAEIVQNDMLTERDPEYRVGCCGAFGRIRSAVYDAYDNSNSRQWSDMLKLVSDASAKFADLYMADGEKKTGNCVYWMGTRSNVGQQRRITALLTAAKVLR